MGVAEIINQMPYTERQVASMNEDAKFSNSSPPTFAAVKACRALVL